VSYSRKPLVSVTIADCRVETFRASGHGGQAVNKRDTAVRVTHTPSRATAVSREHRGQLENKRAAFGKMVRSREFQNWLRIESAARLGSRSIDDIVDEQMSPANIRTEVKENGKWTRAGDPDV
jgi:protein subunit release factor A